MRFKRLRVWSKSFQIGLIICSRCDQHHKKIVIKYDTAFWDFGWFVYKKGERCDYCGGGISAREETVHRGFVLRKWMREMHEARFAQYCQDYAEEMDKKKEEATF